MFDEFLFLEIWLPGYHGDQRIADIDDIDVVLNNDYTDDRKESLERAGLLSCSRDELISERNRLMRNVLTDAFNNYIKLNYGH